MRVSLAPSPLQTARIGAEARVERATPLMQGAPRVVLGGQLGPDGLAEPIVPGPTTLFGPRGATLASSDGPLFVCDTGHHRLLAWRRAPEAATTRRPISSSASATSAARAGTARARSDRRRSTCRPGSRRRTGVLAIADAWNHRVLIWLDLPESTNCPADVVLGHEDFSGASRQSRTRHSARRHAQLVLRRRHRGWPADRRRHREPARAAFGTRSRRGTARRPTSFSASATSPRATRMPAARRARSACAGRTASRWSMAASSSPTPATTASWPGASIPGANGVPCDFVIGQADMRSVDHNRAAYYPTARSLNMPYGLARRRASI